MTAAYRGRGEKKEDSEQERWGARETDGVREESKEINESRTGWRGRNKGGRLESSAVKDVLL